MFTRKALVDQAITLKNPDRVPLWVDGPNIGLSDVLTYDLSLASTQDPTLSEWGFKRMRARSGNWIVPKEGVLDTWDKVDAFELPAMDAERRFARIPAAARVCGDRYRLASFGLSGYSIYSALRGVKLCYDDCLRDFDRFTEFFDKILEFETEMFDVLARKGFHGIEFCDDWGPRKTSRVTLSLWRVLFRERYALQFKRAKEVGLQVWMSSSEESAEFFSDLKDIGVDVVRVEDPDRMEVSTIGRFLRGRTCFATRVDNLYDAAKPEESYQAIRGVRECLGALTGGFIATLGADAPVEKIKAVAEMVKDFKGVM